MSTTTIEKNNLERQAQDTATMQASPISIVSLFSGCGGMDLEFHLTGGFEIK